MRFVLHIIIILSGISFAQFNSKFTIGTTVSILDSMVKQNIRAHSVYPFQVSETEKIPATIEDFYFKDGILAMSGSVSEEKNSLVMLKGDVTEIYGWVILRDSDCAWEYTTDASGYVTVEKVPVSNVFCIDNFEPPKGHHESYTPLPEFLREQSSPPAPHIGKYPGTEVNKLQSFPEAKKVLYMDITRMMNGDTPKTQTKEDVWLTWAVVAGAYSAFKLNVTTDAAVYKAAGVPNSGILRYLDIQGRSSSPVRCFGTKQYATCYRIRGAGHQPGPYCAGRTGWHESGHVMGTLDYGGKPGGTYFEGFPAFKWVPIMGNFWFSDPWKDDGVQQWSKGEYATATCKSDMLAIVAKIAPYRDDDIPQTKPIKISGASKVLPEDNYGQIAPNTDSDGFSFEIVGNNGHVNLKVERTEWLSDHGNLGIGGTMLDVDASIIDASGNVIIQHNPQAVRSAHLDIDLPQGTYTLLVKGGAEGTPKKGFSNYGSIGFYAISGEIKGGTTALTAVGNVKNILNTYSITRQGIIILSIPDSYTIEKISVFSASGERVFETTKRVQTIDLSHTATGIYMMNVSVDGATLVKKIVKK